jgi:two-component system, LuxR family, response regulator FixJ
MDETVYIIDLIPEELRRISDAVASEPVVVKSYADAVEFLDQVATTASGCVLVPLDLPGMGVRALIDKIKHRHLPLAVVVLGRDSEFTTALDLVRHGAFDFLEHPFSDRQLRLVVRRAIGV